MSAISQLVRDVHAAVASPYLPPAVSQALRESIMKVVLSWAEKWTEHVSVDSWLDYHAAVLAKSPAELRLRHDSASLRSLVNEVVEKGRENGILRMEDFGRDHSRAWAARTIRASASRS